jgi:C1A family cysteine protease
MGLFRFAGLAITLIAVLVACPEPTKPPTLNAPKITAFTATPNTLTKAGTVTLEWTVTDASSLSIAPNVGAVTGLSKTVNITVSTTFELTAQNSSGTDKKTVSVTVPAQNLEEFFTPDKTWTKPIPSNAETISPEEFKRQVEAGELRMVTTDSRAAALQARQLEYQNDLSYLQNLTQPSGLVTALLARVAASANIRAEPIAMQNGKPVVLLSLAQEVSQSANAQRSLRDQSVQQGRYASLYGLLSKDQRSELATPQSLTAATLTQIKEAFALLETRLGLMPNLDGETKAVNTATTTQGDAISTRMTPIPGMLTQNDAPCPKNPTGLYTRFSWTLKDFVTPIRDQGQRGMCWAFAATAAIESRVLVQTGVKLNLSEQFMVNKVKHDYDNEDYEDGYSSEAALNDLLENNQTLPPENYWAYNTSPSRKFDGEDMTGSDAYYGSCDTNTYNGSCSESAHQSTVRCATFNGRYCGYYTMTFTGSGTPATKPGLLWDGDDEFPLNEARARLANGQALMASFGIRVGFQSPESGFVTDFRDGYNNSKGIFKSGSQGAHVVLIVGFLDAASVRFSSSLPDGARVPGFVPEGIAGYFIIKNSWGCGVGDGGFYYIPDTYVRRYFTEITALNFDNQRSAAWQAQKNPSIYTIGSNRIQTDLRALTALLRVAAPYGETLASLQIQISSSDPSDSFTNEDFFGLRTFRSTFATPGRRTVTVTARSANGFRQDSMEIMVINTAPEAVFIFPSPIYANQNPAPTFNTTILDKNETNPQNLCSTARWLVAPSNTIDDLLDNTVTGGCSHKIHFASAGKQALSVFVTDSDGLTKETILSVDVLEPPVNPNPIILDGGVKNWDVGGSFGQCLSPVSRPQGSSIDLSVLPTATTGCTGQTNPRTLQGYVNLQNPDNETLTYTWTLDFQTSEAANSGIRTMASGRNANFEIPTIQYGDGGILACFIRVEVTPVNDASRVKRQQIWGGQCKFAAVVPR